MPTDATAATHADRTDGATVVDAASRPPLSRDRVLAAALALADADGFEAVTMRAVASSLGVEAMSLYHHVANKDAVLDGLVEVVIEECLAAVASVDLPQSADDWRGNLRLRVLTAREVMLRHPWAPSLIESRTALPFGVVRWMDGVLAVLRAGGFSWDLAHHSLHALGSRALGFSQELFQPAPGDEDDPMDLDAMATLAPSISAMLDEVVHDEPDTTLGWCDDQTEFEFGLDVLLEGLERRLRG